MPREVIVSANYLKVLNFGNHVAFLLMSLRRKVLEEKNQKTHVRIDSDVFLHRRLKDNMN